MIEVEQITAPPVTFLEPLSLTEAFHRVNSLIPEDQEIRNVSPGTPVCEALQIMREHQYSQLPVMLGRRVIGVVSFRSIATRAIALGHESVDLGSLPVEEFVEDLEYTHIFEDFAKVFPTLDRDDAILVGRPDRLQGIVTAMDVVHHLHKTARAFVLLAEIEQTLRRLIRASVDRNDLLTCVQTALTHYKPSKRPSELEEMYFYDLIQIIVSEKTWPSFQAAFGGIGEWHRHRTKSILTEVKRLRNDVFHFKRELDEDDHDKLEECRIWLLRRATILEALVGGE